MKRGLKMKRTVVFLMILMLMMASATAFAAGKIRVTQENFHLIESYGKYGYAYAKVENVGDRQIKVHAGILEIFDENGDVITSTDYLRNYAEYLQPDEYTYVYLRAEIENENMKPDDFMLTITGKSDNAYKTQRLPVEMKYEEDVRTRYGTTNYMSALVTNDTDEPVYNITVLLVLLDNEENILYMESTGLGRNTAIMPGSSVMFRVEVSSSFKEYFKNEGLIPMVVDAIAYTNI